ncbi:MAG: universal stress protein [Planctomycetota bacterium]
MQPPKHLLVALDLEPGGAELTLSSRRALTEALVLATEFKTRLDVIHSTGIATYEFAESYALRHEGLSDAGQAVLDGVMGELEQLEIPGQALIYEEKPWVALTREVEQRGADLVIVGRRDDEERSGLGRVSKKIVHVVPAEVLVVQGRGAEQPRPKTIVAATDLSEVGGLAIGAAALFAKHFSSKLHVIHAFQLTMTEHMSGRDRAELVKELATEARSAVAEQIRSTGSSVEAKVHVGCTTPHRAIDEAIERYQADLLVLGTTSRGGLANLVIGNVAERVLETVKTSILAVKPDDFGASKRPKK